MNPKYRILVSVLIDCIAAGVFLYGAISFEEKILFGGAAVLCLIMAIRNIIRFVNEG